MLTPIQTAQSQTYSLTHIHEVTNVSVKPILSRRQMSSRVSESTSIESGLTNAIYNIAVP